MVAEARRAALCLQCARDMLDAGEHELAEWRISGLCDACFEAIFEGDDELDRCRLCGQPHAAATACRMWCRDCGAALVRDDARYAYAHPEPGADHAPRPTTRKPEAQP